MYNTKANTVELACTNQPYEIAFLGGYKRDCSYCGINFIVKPDQIRFDYDPIAGLFVDIIWHKPTLSIFLDDNSDEKIYFAIVGPNPRTRVLEVTILEAIEVTYTETEKVFGEVEEMYHCKRLVHSDTSLINRVAAAYKRNFLSGYELSAPLYSFNKLAELTVTPGARNCDIGVIEELKKALQNISNKDLTKLGVSHMIKNVPVITRCIINDPAVVVFWSDGTKTIGKCMGDDEFNPEIGLAMAISRKYYEVIGFPNPRAAFKYHLKHAENRSAKTKEKRERKMKLLATAKAEE